MPLRQLLVLAFLLALRLPAVAQDGPSAQSGSMLVADWPQSAVKAGLLSAAQIEEATLLPDIKALRLGYELIDHDGQPRLFVQLTWEHGHHGRLDGERVAYEVLPEDTRLVALEVHTRVTRDDEAVADFYLALDDLDLAAAPAVFEITIDTLAWSDLFPNLSADSARSLLAQGFTLEQPQILSATFIPGGDGFYTQVADRPENDNTRRRHPGPTVVTAHPGVWIDIWIHSPPRRVYDRPRQAPSRPRGTLTRGAEGAESSGGRSTPGHRAGTDRRDGEKASNEGNDGSSRADSSRSGGRGWSDLFKGKEDGDEDDDDESLLPAALVGVAAVGVLAYAGGTVGYYGHASDAPIGLSAGYVRRGGGVLLQVAVNDAVINGRDVPEHLVAKMTGFFDAFNGPVQPALGVGVHAEQYRGDHDLSPSVSLGAAVQSGPGVFYVGYDVVSSGVDVTLAFNFRHRRSSR